MDDPQHPLVVAQPPLVDGARNALDPRAERAKAEKMVYGAPEGAMGLAALLDDLLNVRAGVEVLDALRRLLHRLGAHFAQVEAAAFQRERAEERKAIAKIGAALEDMMAYIDENGNISNTPPDPKKMKIFNSEDMQISVPKYVADEADNEPRKGVVSFFNTSKGFGFINDLKSGERIFIHINQLTEAISENDKVTFDVESGPRGLTAVNVKKQA